MAYVDLSKVLTNRSLWIFIFAVLVFSLAIGIWELIQAVQLLSGAPEERAKAILGMLKAAMTPMASIVLLALGDRIANAAEERKLASDKLLAEFNAKLKKEEEIRGQQATMMLAKFSSDLADQAAIEAERRKAESDRISKQLEEQYRPRLEKLEETARRRALRMEALADIERLNLKDRRDLILDFSNKLDPCVKAFENLADRGAELRFPHLLDDLTDALDRRSLLTQSANALRTHRAMLDRHDAVYKNVDNCLVQILLDLRAPSREGQEMPDEELGKALRRDKEKLQTAHQALTKIVSVFLGVHDLPE